MIFRRKKYKVSLKGRSGITYLEGDRIANIEAEMMTGDIDLVIYFDRFRAWAPPNEKDYITEEDRKRIRENVTEELESKGMVLDWE